MLNPLTRGAGKDDEAAIRHFQLYACMGKECPEQTR